MEIEPCAASVQRVCVNNKCADSYIQGPEYTGEYTGVHRESEDWLGVPP